MIGEREQNFLYSTIKPIKMQEKQTKILKINQKNSIMCKNERREKNETMEQDAFSLDLSHVCSLCLHGTKEDILIGGEEDATGTIQSIEEDAVFLRIDQIDQRNDQLKTGDVVALRTLEMKELDPEEFSSLQVGEVLDITYFNMNEENDIPVLYVSRWELQTQ